MNGKKAKNTMVALGLMRFCFNIQYYFFAVVFQFWDNETRFHQP